MLRPLFTVLLAVAFAAASAQTFEPTEAMKAKAAEKTQLVERTVGGLDATQRTEVEKVYLEVEKYVAALEFRYQNVRKEVRDADMPPQLDQMDRYAQEKLASILTKEQFATWTEASR